MNAFLELGVDRLAGESVCFINLTESFLIGQLPLPLPADRVVIEVLEDVLPTREVIEGVRRLRGEGVRIAMDDYIHRAENVELLKLCDYVKIDLRAQGRGQTRELVGMLRPYGVKLLAEKVETAADLDYCKDLDFDYFQGFFLTKPEIIEGERLPANRIALLRTLSQLLDPDADLDELQELISRDVSLAYRLLRYSNSSLYSPRQPITAIGQTLMMLGLKAVRTIVSLILLVDLDDKPGDLLSQSLVRAKMCESMATRAGIEDPTPYFTVGLRANLDALICAPMATVIGQLSLAQPLVDALLDGQGELGEVLACARSFERGEWDRTVYSELTAVDLNKCYLEGVEYSREVWSALPTDAPPRKAV